MHLGFAASLALSLLSLPPPPDQIVRVTHYFGTVTVDHRAHLRRRSACKSCHGPGLVGKLALSPRMAHDRCRGCHVARGRGPADCRGCHTLADEARVQQAPPPENASDDLTPMDAMRVRLPGGSLPEPIEGVVYAPLDPAPK